jgi:hypothetical protein
MKRDIIRTQTGGRGWGSNGSDINQEFSVVTNLKKKQKQSEHYVSEATCFCRQVKPVILNTVDQNITDTLP